MVNDAAPNKIAKARQVAANEIFERSGIGGENDEAGPASPRELLERLHHEGERKQRRKKQRPVAGRPPGDDDAHEHGGAPAKQSGSAKVSDQSPRLALEAINPAPSHAASAIARGRAITQRAAA